MASKSGRTRAWSRLGDREVQRAASAVFVPIPFGGRIVGVLSIQSSKPNAYDDEDLLLLESCAIYLGARIHDEEQRAATEQLQHIATTDALTGLANRRAFDEALAREWHRCARSRTPLSLLMVDVDYFKTFNDAYGHVAGDTCLRQIAQTVGDLREASRRRSGALRRRRVFDRSARDRRRTRDAASGAGVRRGARRSRSRTKARRSDT